jgi:hypothetical protein
MSLFLVLPFFWPQTKQSARLSFRSSELGPPLTREGALLLPPLSPWGKTHSLAGEEVGGGRNSEEWTDTLVLYVYYNPIGLPPVDEGT